LGTPSNTLLLYYTLYTDYPGGRTDAVVRHVSFAQSTCYSTITVGGFRCAFSRFKMSQNHQIAAHKSLRRCTRTRPYSRLGLGVEDIPHTFTT